MATCAFSTVVCADFSFWLAGVDGHARRLQVAVGLVARQPQLVEVVLADQPGLLVALDVAHRLFPGELRALQSLRRFLARELHRRHAVAGFREGQLRLAQRDARLALVEHGEHVALADDVAFLDVELRDDPGGTREDFDLGFRLDVRRRRRRAHHLAPFDGHGAHAHGLAPLDLSGELLRLRALGPGATHAQGRTRGEEGEEQRSGEGRARAPRGAVGSATGRGRSHAGSGAGRVFEGAGMRRYTAAMRSVEEAIVDILARVRPLEAVESVDLLHALGRVLARDVFSDVDLPPFQKSAMDGYAVRSSDFGAGPDVGEGAR